MSYQTGTAASVGDLLQQLDAFLRLGHALAPSFTTASDGQLQGLIGTAASVVETITITFTDATHFTVAGSVSGNLGAGTLGVPFASTVCAFTLAAGATPFAAADSIAFVMTAPWQRLNYTDAQQYIWQAPGNDGSSTIYVGASRFTDASADYDDLKLAGMSGYSSTRDFFSQINECADPVVALLRTGAMPYWFVANGRRVVVMVKCSTIYTGFYLGFINSYLDPSAWPYPLCVGGAMAFDNWPGGGDLRYRWSYTGDEHRAFVKSRSGPTGLGQAESRRNLRLRRPDGIWRGYTADTPGFTNGQESTIWPYSQGATDVRPGLDGSYPLLPIILSDDSPAANIWGELDGVLWTTGHANASENTYTQGRTKYVVFQNIFRTTRADYFALQLT